MLKILEVSLGVAAWAGGPVRSITGLTRVLSLVDGCKVAYFIHNPEGIGRFDLAKTKVMKGHWDETTRRDASGDFERALDEFRPDVVHFHGLWHLILHDDQAACRKRGIMYLIAPRGSLDAWSMSQKVWKKRLAMALFQRRDLNRALALHVTAKMEEDHCRRLGLKGPYLTSPNGVNLPDTLPPRMCSGKKTALFMSRMHPKKGVLELVRAWANVRPDDWQCELVYTLNGDEERAYEVKVKDEVRVCGLGDSFVFTGPLDDQRKWEAYRRADFFVLPTHTENFGIVIAEALYSGLPVLTTKNAPWEGLLSHQCGWWIDLEQEQFVGALRQAMVCSDRERQEMGTRGRQYVLENYSWSSIAEKFACDCRLLLERVRT